MNEYAVIIRDRLTSMQDIEYKKFTQKLIPNIENDNVIGVRMPEIRTLAKEIIKEGNRDEYLTFCPHIFLEENLLCSVLISSLKNYGEAVLRINEFLPYIDNWSVCDILNPVILSKQKCDLRFYISELISSGSTYSIRFGVGLAMRYFLDADFDIDLCDEISGIRSDEYYVEMMIAWYFATALAKQWESVIPFIENHLLSKWCENKTIQKAIESYRISPEQKAFLRGLRLKNE